MAGSDVSSVSNHFATVVEGFNTTTSSSTSAGATTVELTSVTNLTNGDVFVGLIEPGETKEQAFTGTVDTSGSQITGVKWTRGSNVTHNAGVVVVDYTTGTIINMIKKGILVEHKQDGSHKAITTPSIVVDDGGTIDVDTINEATADNGVKIDGVTLKDGIVKPRESTTASTASLTPDCDTYDFYTVTALAAALTVNAPTGTPVNGQKLVFRFKDDGTARAITWNAAFRAVGVDLPTTTVISKTVYVGCLYNSAASKWDAIAVAEEE